MIHRVTKEFIKEFGLILVLMFIMGMLFIMLTFGILIHLTYYSAAIVLIFSSWLLIRNIKRWRRRLYEECGH